MRRINQPSPPKNVEDGQALIDAWRTNNRVTTYLIENLPDELWSKAVPGAPRRTIRTIAAHIHNARCMWIKMIGGRHGVVVPKSVDGRTVRPAELSRAFAHSSRGIIDLIRLGVDRGGTIPPAAWQNFPYRPCTLPYLLRRSRGTPSRTVVHVGAPIGTSVTGRCDERTMAMEARSGSLMKPLFRKSFANNG